MMAEVGDAERLTVVLKGFSNQVRPFPWCNRAGRVVDSGGEGAFIEADVPSVNHFVCRCLE